MLISFIYFLYYQSSKVTDKLQHPTDGPSGVWDHIIVGFSILIVLIVLFLTVKYFIKPGEKQQNHIKRLILKDEKTAGLEKRNERPRYK